MAVHDATALLLWGCGCVDQQILKRLDLGGQFADQPIDLGVLDGQLLRKRIDLGVLNGQLLVHVVQIRISPSELGLSFTKSGL